MTAHELARILDPPVFGYRVWLCTCGHRSPDLDTHNTHNTHTEGKNA